MLLTGPALQCFKSLFCVIQPFISAWKCLYITFSTRWYITFFFFCLKPSSPMAKRLVFCRHTLPSLLTSCTCINEVFLVFFYSVMYQTSMHFTGPTLLWLKNLFSASTHCFLDAYPLSILREAPIMLYPVMHQASMHLTGLDLCLRVFCTHS